MLAKLLIGLITVSYSDYCLTEAFVLCTCSRLFPNMYINKKLHIRWQDEFSEKFTATNGVKKGGVISPILFCVYMDGLLTELANSGYDLCGWCFAGAFGYADDLKHLTPSVYALHQMAHICENYAKRYDITFNTKKVRLSFIKLTM